MNWPNDVDGDVLRKMQESGFDFSKETEVDFNIDFDHWPITEEEYNFVKRLYPDCKFYEDNGTGYAQFKMRGFLTHKFVTSIQKMVSDEVHQVGGFCESWGVLVTP